ncbi:MAG: hypothetical protein NT169_23885 [Chloroflexi bacterium]|nr:hypothetical protein [Chloroflexota bacterium]
MKKSFALMALVAILVLATALTAFAGFTWCMTDPAIQLPDGRGVVHLYIGVESGHQNDPVEVKVWAPKGSQVIGDTGNITVDLKNGKDDELKAKVKLGFPVELTAEYQGNMLTPAFVFEDGKGTAEWSLP